MNRKTTLYHFITFIIIFTVLFSSNSIEIFAVPSTDNAQSAQTLSESASETTTEAPSVVNNYTGDNKTLPLNSRAAILMDATTGTIIYEKNAHEKLYPASITKVLTGYIACSEGNMDDTITLSQTAYDGKGAGGSSIGIVPGEQINYEDALYGIMLASANELCMGVAEHISGSISAFVEKMNAVATKAGCKESHFANPHGFHDPNHYTTCYDMALITKLAITDENFYHIWGSVSHQIPPTNMNESRYLSHRDQMLLHSSNYYYPEIMGGKTGFTDEAGNTLVSYAERDGAALIAVVMKGQGTDVTFTDTKTLLDYGFSLYGDTKTIFNANDYKITPDVIQEYNGKTYRLGSVAISSNQNVEMALPNFMDISKITVKPVVDEQLKAPVELDTIVGKIELYYGDTLLKTIDAVAVSDAPALSDKMLAKRALKENLRKYVMVPAMVLLILFMLILITTFIRGAMNIGTGKNKRRKKKRHRPKQNPHNRKPRPQGQRPRPKKGKGGKRPVKKSQNRPANRPAKRPVRRNDEDIIDILYDED